MRAKAIMIIVVLAIMGSLACMTIKAGINTFKAIDARTAQSFDYAGIK